MLKIYKNNNLFVIPTFMQKVNSVWAFGLRNIKIFVNKEFFIVYYL